MHTDTSNCKEVKLGKLWFQTELHIIFRNYSIMLNTQISSTELSRVSMQDKNAVYGMWHHAYTMLPSIHSYGYYIPQNHISSAWKQSCTLHFKTTAIMSINYLYCINGQDEAKHDNVKLFPCSRRHRYLSRDSLIPQQKTGILMIILRL